MTKSRREHLLVIGAQRSGSSYLREALDAHPQVAMARPARPEPKVFCDDERCAHGLDWYHQTFFGDATDEQLLGDKSTSYLEDPKAPARAAEMLGRAHVVALLRDPVRRAVSNWRFSTQHGLETRPLEEALLADVEGERPWDPTVTSVSPFAYVRRGRYVGYLEPWTSTFPDSTHVLFLEELLDDPAVLQRLFADLGVDPALAPTPPDYVVNASDGEPPVVSDRLLATLRSYYEESDAALAARLGRTLPW